MIKFVCDIYALLLGILIVLVLLFLSLYVVEHYLGPLELDPAIVGDNGWQREGEGSKTLLFFSRHRPIVVALGLYILFCVLIGPAALLCDIRACVRKMVKNENSSESSSPAVTMRTEPHL